MKGGEYMLYTGCQTYKSEDTIAAVITLIEFIGSIFNLS